MELTFRKGEIAKGNYIRLLEDIDFRLFLYSKVECSTFLCFPDLKLKKEFRKIIEEKEGKNCSIFNPEIIYKGSKESYSVPLFTAKYYSDPISFANSFILAAYYSALGEESSSSFYSAASKMTRNILLTANNNGVKNLSIPSLTLGKEQEYEGIILAMLENLYKYPHKLNPSYIFIHIPDKNLFNTFLDIAKEKFGENDIKEEEKTIELKT